MQTPHILKQCCKLIIDVPRQTEKAGMQVYEVERCIQIAVVLQPIFGTEIYCPSLRHTLNVLNTWQISLIRPTTTFINVSCYFL